MIEVVPLPAAPPKLDERARANLRRLLESESAAGVLPALDDRDATPSDLRTLALGARLALDGWQQRPWTAEVLAAITEPSPAWRSALLAVDAGLRGAAAALARALDDGGRRALTAAALEAPRAGSLSREIRLAWMREWTTLAHQLLAAARPPSTSPAAADSSV
jgi:hypothetical protein